MLRPGAVGRESEEFAPMLQGVLRKAGSIERVSEMIMDVGVVGVIGERPSERRDGEF